MERFGEYVLLDRLGVGSGGTVHLARRLDPAAGTDRLLVVKRLHEELSDKSTFVRRFSHEALIAVSVDSPHVVRVDDVGRVGGTPYIAMEYTEGARLIDVLRKLAGRDELAPLDILVSIIAGGFAGLAALHDAVHPETLEPLHAVHRDVSPSNLILSYEGHLQLIDLGLGKSNVQDWQTRAGTVLGSLGYMAPEQVMADRIDHRCDVYAMTAVFYELLTLRPYIPRGDRREMLRAMATPNHEPPSKSRRDVPTVLDELVAEGLAVDPDDRPQTAHAMRERLAEVVAPAEPARVSAFLIDLFATERSAETSRVRDFLLMPLESVRSSEPSEPAIVFARRASTIRTMDEVEALDTEDRRADDDPTTILDAHDDEPAPSAKRVPIEPRSPTVRGEPERVIVEPRPIPSPAAPPPIRVVQHHGIPVGVVAMMLIVAVAVTVLVDRLVIGSFESELTYVAQPGGPDAASVKSVVRRLDARVELLRRLHPARSAELDAIKADVAAWSKSKSYDKATNALARLEAALDRIAER